jgi:uracil-DNA glycosylase
MAGTDLRLADRSGHAANATVADALADLAAAGSPAVVPASASAYADVALRSAAILPTELQGLLAPWLVAQQFCPGPPPVYAHRFAIAPNLEALFPGAFRPAFGPVFYRGRLDGSARLLVVGQDPSSDEQLVRRAFVGFSGQRLQRFLDKLGLVSSYTIVNTFHWCVQGNYSTNSALRDAIEHPDVVAWRNDLLDQLVADNEFDAVVAIGTPAREAVEIHWPGAEQFADRVVPIWHPSALDVEHLLSSWNGGLSRLLELVTPDGEPDPTPYGTEWTDADHAPIPRRDLPFGTPDWHGSGGQTRSKRPDPQRIEWTAP